VRDESASLPIATILARLLRRVCDSANSGFWTRAFPACSPLSSRVCATLGTSRRGGLTGPDDFEAAFKAASAQQEMIADYLAHDLKAFTSKTINEADSLRRIVDRDKFQCHPARSF